MNKKSLIISAIAVVGLLLLAYLFLGDAGTATTETQDILTEVKRGNLDIQVTTTGELQAKNSVNIMGPTGLRNARIWEVKINDMVEEGTVVKKGGFIASLDQSELAEKIREEELELLESRNKWEQTKIDTAIELRKARDNLINLGYDVEEKVLILSQSKYEPPATIKQAELDLEKGKRALLQAKNEYKLLKDKSISQMTQANAKMRDDQADMDFLVNLSKEFVIKAPENGMVIYTRDWGGRKIGKGSSIQTYFPLVATLPDLSSMISKTYVNEVDVSRVKSGQEVQIGLDAFPDKVLSGKITSVANIGEQRPNSDAKVFEVTVAVNESDTTLRPAMTTSNAIFVDNLEDVLYVPLESLHSQGDTLTYVFKKTGFSTVKQQVITGKKGNDVAIILNGVEEGNQIYLSIPNDADEKQLVLLNGEKEEPLATHE